MEGYDSCFDILGVFSIFASSLITYNMDTKEIVKIIKTAMKDCPISGKGKDKRDKIQVLQCKLAELLNGNGNNNTEVYIFNQIGYTDIKDRADVYVEKDDCEIIIEIDATRADQVAKKLVSRLCYHIMAKRVKKRLIYVALLYRGTENMPEEECKKYFSFCSEIVARMGDSSEFIGCIIPQNNKDINDGDFHYQHTPVTQCVVQVPAPKGQRKSSIFELLERDAYADYLQDCGYTLGSIYSYLRAVSLVGDELMKNPKASVEECIKGLIDNNKGSYKTYLNRYLEWWIMIK